MGSPEAKGQPAMPKGSSACRGWGFSTTRDFPFTQTFSHSLCHCSHGLAAPPRPRRNTLLLTQTSRCLPSHQLSHTQALPFTSAREHSPRISSLWSLFCFPPLPHPAFSSTAQVGTTWKGPCIQAKQWQLIPVFRSDH